MKVLVVDSELPSREQIKRLLNNIDDVELASQDAREGREAVSLVQRWHPDIVLMEAHVSPEVGMDGIEAAHYMKHLAPPPAVILCSSNPGDALDAYNAHASGFLVKPFDEGKLTEVIEFASQLNQLQLRNLSSSKQEHLEELAGGGVNQQPQHISAKTHRGIELIPIKDILCFKADNKYVTVYHTKGEVLIDRTLKSLQEQLSDKFIRIHRNALVAKSAITGLERKSGGSYFIRLSALDMIFSVSRRHVPIMRKIIKTL